MIESLKGTANIAVTIRQKGNREHTYQFGGEPIKRIQKCDIPGCRDAWRYSKPVVVDEFPETLTRISEAPDEYLISFYDALAMIQTECFMLPFEHSKVVSVTDEDMMTLEWLHESIRNEYEHFIPKLYSAAVDNLLLASKIALTTASKCLFDSGNVLVYVPETTNNLKDKFNSLLEVISNRRAAAG
jgi:hypothetical protein